MKKLLAIIVLGLLWSSNALANPTAFICKNKDGKEREYTLLIDLKKKLLIRAGTEYPIVEIEDRFIKGLIKRDGYELSLTFNRYTGLLRFINWEDGSMKPKDFAEYNCTKAKKLI